MKPSPLSRETKEEYKTACYEGLRFISPKPEVSMIRVSVAQQCAMNFKRLENCIAYLSYLKVLNCWGLE